MFYSKPRGVTDMEVERPKKEIVLDPQKVVFKHACIHCKKRFEEDVLVVVMSKPFFCMLHVQCAPFMDFRLGWPHANPLCYYQSKTEFSLMSQ